MNRNFMELLKARWAEGKFVCVGLDSEYSKIPGHILKKNFSVANGLVEFNRAIVDKTGRLLPEIREVVKNLYQSFQLKRISRAERIRGFRG